MAASIRVPEGVIHYLETPETILKDAGKAAVTPIADLSGTTDFLTRLTEGNTWIRVGEFVAGLVLVYVGLKAMFPSTVSAVTAPVKTAAKIGATTA